MRKNILSLGERTITGDNGKIIAAGEINLVDADVLKLNGAGEIYLENTYIAETKLAGEIKAKNSRFGVLRLAGEMKAEGKCLADTVIVIGELWAESLECRILRNYSNKDIDLLKDKNAGATRIRYHKYLSLFIDNPPDRDFDVKMVIGNNSEKLHSGKKSYSKSEGSVFKGNFKAETFENLCDFNLDFCCRFKHILSTNVLHHKGVLECEEFYSFGPLDMEGINAEYIYIHPCKGTNLSQVMGSEIRITGKFFMDETFKLLPKSAGTEFYVKAAEEPASVIEVELIEGDTVAVDHVNAKKICGEKVAIGDNCNIDYVEYKSEIQISPSSFVKEVIRVE